MEPVSVGTPEGCLLLDVPDGQVAVVNWYDAEHEWVGVVRCYPGKHALTFPGAAYAQASQEPI